MLKLSRGGQKIVRASLTSKENQLLTVIIKKKFSFDEALQMMGKKELLHEVLRSVGNNDWGLNRK